MNNCIECNKKFKSIKSLEYHKMICLYYNYKLFYLNKLELDKEILENIIVYYNSINNKSDIISSREILNNIKLRYILTKETYLLYIYNIFITNQQNYYNKYDIIKIISELIHQPYSTVYNIINIYELCSNRIL
jgi:hypothetical protein